MAGIAQQLGCLPNFHAKTWPDALKPDKTCPRQPDAILYLDGLDRRDSQDSQAGAHLGSRPKWRALGGGNEKSPRGAPGSAV